MHNGYYVSIKIWIVMIYGIKYKNIAKIVKDWKNEFYLGFLINLAIIIFIIIKLITFPFNNFIISEIIY